MWQPESECAEQDAFQALKEFLLAVEMGEKDEWLNKFFEVSGPALTMQKIDEGGELVETRLSEGYPKVDVPNAILDIFSRFENREGHSVYRCPEYERIYIQNEYFSDEYACYEKRPVYSRTARELVGTK